MKQLGESTASRGESGLLGTSHKGKRESPTCYRCNQVGHIRRNCPTLSRSQNHYQKTHKARGAEDKIQSESDNDEGEASGVFTASEGVSGKENRRLIDSGASSHMTNDKELLLDYKAMEVAENVALGNVYMNMRFDKRINQQRSSVQRVIFSLCELLLPKAMF